MIGVRPQAMIRGIAGRPRGDRRRRRARVLDATDPFGDVEDVVRAGRDGPAGRAPRLLGRGRRATSATTSSAPSSACPGSRPTTSACRPGGPRHRAGRRLRPPARSLTIVAPCAIADGDDLEAAYWRTVATIADLKARLSGPVPRPPERGRRARARPGHEQLHPRDFEAAVERAREYIFAGDAFQVVPSQRFSAPMSARPLRGLSRPAHGQPVARTCTSSRPAR